MTTQEAKQNIGKPFKPVFLIQWDTIKVVHENGEIEGDKYIAPAEDCRLKGEVPAALQEHLNKMRANKKV